MNQDELKAIQSGTVDDIHKQVDSIKDVADLDALREIEKADANPRKGVFDALDRRAAELAEAAPPPPAAKPSGAKVPKAAAEAAPPPEWQKRDYLGPLTGDQAAWRNANLKPVEKVVTK